MRSRARPRHRSTALDRAAPQAATRAAPRRPCIRKAQAVQTPAIVDEVLGSRWTTTPVRPCDRRSATTSAGSGSIPAAERRSPRKQAGGRACRRTSLAGCSSHVRGLWPASQPSADKVTGQLPARYAWHQALGQGVLKVAVEIVATRGPAVGAGAVQTLRRAVDRNPGRRGAGGERRGPGDLHPAVGPGGPGSGRPAGSRGSPATGWPFACRTAPTGPWRSGGPCSRGAVVVPVNLRFIPEEVAVNARILARLIPGARLEVVRGGHLFLLELAPSAAALVGGFRHAAARPGGGGPATAGTCGRGPEVPA